MIHFLPLNLITSSFQPELSDAIQRVVSGGWYLQGHEVSSFEHEFADYLHVGHCVGVGNGLDALTLSLMAMKECYHLPDDAEVIIPNMTFIATAEAVVRARLVPVLVDVSASCGVLTIEGILQGMTAHTRILLPVHLYGYPAPMPEICRFAEAHGLLVLEDAAQAHGAQIGGKRIGTWGNMAAFSFYPGKNLGALGDGGAVVTDQPELAHCVKVLANYGAEKKYHHTKMGINSRLDEIQAAVLRIKLKRLDLDNNRRRHIASIYSRNLNPEIVHIPFDGNVSDSVFHIYPVRTPKRQQLQTYLAESGIETLIHYPLVITEQEAMKDYISHSPASTPCAARWAAEELSLPISPLMTEEEAYEVIEKINRFENMIGK